MWRRLQPAHTRLCTQEDSKVDVLGAASAPLEHMTTDTMYLGATRKGELGKRLQREVELLYCGAPSTIKERLTAKTGMLDDDAELSRPHGWQNRRAHHRKALRDYEGLETHLARSRTQSAITFDTGLFESPY